MDGRMLKELFWLDSTRELNEDKIRPHIIIDRLSPVPEETKRRAFLRAGGDGLQTDDTSQSCENTVQGVNILTDSMGTDCTSAFSSCIRMSQSDTLTPAILALLAPCRICLHPVPARQRQTGLLQRVRHDLAADKAIHVRSMRYKPPTLLRSVRTLCVLLHASPERERFVFLCAAIRGVARGF